MTFFQRASLRAVATIRGGKRLAAGEAFTNEKTPHPYIRARDIGGGRIEIVDPVFLPLETARRLHRYTVSSGDICITIVGANVGDMGAVPAMLHGANLTENAVKIVSNGKSDQTYLKYALLSDDAHRQMKVLAGGAAQPKLGIYKLETVEIPLPPLPEQRRIACILSAYDDLIDNNVRRIAILEEMAQRIYGEWFVRFRFPGHDNVRIVESEVGPVPEGWHKTNLSDLCVSVEDGDWIETKDQGGRDFRLLQISNVGLNTFVETGNYRYVSEETFNRLRCREVIPGNILVARMPKPIGRAWLVTPQPWRMITAVDVAIVDVDPAKTSKEFVVAFLNSEATLAAFAGQTSGTTRPRITRKQIASMPVVAPSAEIASRFAQVVQPMNELTATLAAKNANLRATRDLLIPKLISGELDVSSLPEPEAAVA
jgi:type I restriction enzyme, S subunit